MKKTILIFSILSLFSISTSYAANIYAPFVPAYTKTDNTLVSVRADLDVTAFTDGSIEILLDSENNNPTSQYIVKLKNHFYYFISNEGKILGIWNTIDRQVYFYKNTAVINQKLSTITPTPFSPVLQDSEEYKLAMYAYNFAKESGKLAEAKKKPKKPKKIK